MCRCIVWCSGRVCVGGRYVVLILYNIYYMCVVWCVLELVVNVGGGRYMVYSICVCLCLYVTACVVVGG